MIILGIVLLIVGALIAVVSTGDIERLGRLVAIVGVALLLIGVLLAVLDEGDEELNALVPAIAIGLKGWLPPLPERLWDWRSLANRIRA